MMEKKRGFTDFTRVKVLHKVNKQHSFETTIFLAWVGSRPLVWASQQKIVLGLPNLIIGTNYTEKKLQKEKKKSRGNASAQIDKTIAASIAVLPVNIKHVSL